MTLRQTRGDDDAPAAPSASPATSSPPANSSRNRCVQAPPPRRAQHGPRHHHRPRDQCRNGSGTRWGPTPRSARSGRRPRTGRSAGAAPPGVRAAATKGEHGDGEQGRALAPASRRSSTIPTQRRNRAALRRTRGRVRWPTPRRRDEPPAEPAVLPRPQPGVHRHRQEDQADDLGRAESAGADPKTTSSDERRGQRQQCLRQKI